MKRRSLIAIILAVVCLMTSLSVYAVEAEKCETCDSFSNYCSGIESGRTSETHTAYIGDDDTLTCNYVRVLHYTVKVCTVCEETRTLVGSHRHAEEGHACGRAEDRCPYDPAPPIPTQE